MTHGTRPLTVSYQFADEDLTNEFTHGIAGPAGAVGVLRYMSILNDTAAANTSGSWQFDLGTAADGDYFMSITSSQTINAGHSFVIPDENFNNRRIEADTDLVLELVDAQDNSAVDAIITLVIDWYINRPPTSDAYA